MKNFSKNLGKSEEIFVGIDIHKKSWHITLRTIDVELFSGNIPGKWHALENQLTELKKHPIKAVYEAGFSGFWLHDKLVEHGVDCIVTPPSLIPLEYGNKVKTDRRDSSKLALLLAKGLLKRVHVLTQEECYHRQVVRRRRQLVRDRVRIQNRIKSELLLDATKLQPASGAVLFL